MRLFATEKILGFEVARGDAIVAIELNIIKRGGDSVPPRHGGGLVTLHVGSSSENDVPVAHGLADQDNLEFDASTGSQRLGAKKIDTGRADIARDQRNRKFFGDIADAAQA